MIDKLEFDIGFLMIFGLSFKITSVMAVVVVLSCAVVVLNEHVIEL